MLFVLGVAAFLSGIIMITDPTGSGLGFPEGALAKTPFIDYFIPGILLTIFIGLLPLVACWALWKKPSNTFMDQLNPIPSFHWAWTIALTSGVGLIIWIIVQMTMVPYFFLQPVLLTWGAGMVILCFSPVLRAYFHLGKARG